MLQMAARLFDLARRSLLIGRQHRSIAYHGLRQGDASTVEIALLAYARAISQAAEYREQARQTLREAQRRRADLPATISRFRSWHLEGKGFWATRSRARVALKSAKARYEVTRARKTVMTPANEP
jgi:hypothetical protein